MAIAESAIIRRVDTKFHKAVAHARRAALAPTVRLATHTKKTSPLFPISLLTRNYHMCEPVGKALDLCSASIGALSVFYSHGTSPTPTSEPKALAIYNKIFSQTYRSVCPRFVDAVYWKQLPQNECTYNEQIVTLSEKPAGGASTNNVIWKVV